MTSKKYTLNRVNQDIYLTPKTEPHTSTLVFMHGLGDSAQGWVDLFLEEVNPCPSSTKIVLLTAPSVPVTANQGYVMPSWYDILSWDSKGDDSDSVRSVSEEDVEKNAIRVNSVLDKEIETLKGDSKSVLIGGFSQGCAMALHTGLSFKKTSRWYCRMVWILVSFYSDFKGK